MGQPCVTPGLIGLGSQRGFFPSVTGEDTQPLYRFLTKNTILSGHPLQLSPFVSISPETLLKASDRSKNIPDFLEGNVLMKKELSLTPSLRI